MSRGQKLVAMVMASKVSKNDFVSSHNPADRMLPCSSRQAMQMDLKSNIRSVENQLFTPIVVENNAASYNDDLINIDIDKINTTNEQSLSQTSGNDDKEDDVGGDGVIYDDSDHDPNYTPSDEENESETSNKSSSSVHLMASQMEKNLLECSTPHKRKREEITKKRNLGHEYVTKKGKIVLGRSTKPLDGNCKRKCSMKITFDNQRIIFTDYWNLGNYNLLQAFLSGMIQILPKKTESKIKSLTGQRNRIYSYKYFVEVGTDRIQVCQKCFLCIFDETTQFIKTVTQKKINNVGIAFPSDKRGLNTPSNKISEEMHNAVLEHIKSFPHYESHYTRRHTEQKYLHSDLNMSVMYKLYSERYENRVSITKYTEIFKSLKLKFKKPKLDICNKCDLLQMQMKCSENEEHKLKLLFEKNEHLEQADYAYLSKRDDQMYAKANKCVKAYTFDLQQCLPTPYFRTSVSFYKRQLWTFNLTIHDAEQNCAYNMMWPEAEGNRGGNEISSCLFECFLLNVPSEITHLILYSDSCAGQNKNSFLIAMFQMLIQTLPHLEIVEHKFLTPGHTHMECDTVHASIERKKNKTTATIHHPRDWYNFIWFVNSNYYVSEMPREKFYSFSSLIKEKFMWRKVNTDAFFMARGEMVAIYMQIRPYRIQTTLSREAEFKLLNIHRRGINTISRDDLKLCYPASIKISEKKKRDLLDMLPLISKEFHHFYCDLQTDALPDIDPDLIEEFESEH